MYSSEPVNYDLSNGLDIIHHSMLDPSIERLERLPGTELMPAPPEDGFVDRVHSELGDEGNVSGKLGQRVRYAVLNDQTESPDITLVSLQ